MKIIGVVGFGLIGASFGGALKEYTDNLIYAFDNDEKVLDYGVKKGLCNRAFLPDEKHLKECDIIFIALYPKITVKFINDNVCNFKENAIICDLCGIKSYICNNVNKNIRFIGAHPMAGKEVNGIYNADRNLFKNASFLMAGNLQNDVEAEKEIEELALKIGFSKVVKTTPENHDKMITYTSQLAHIASVAYTFQDAFEKCSGYYAGSFNDMTRVAKINPYMWTEIFKINKDVLTNQIDEYIKSLNDIKDAINKDDEELFNMLKKARELKEWRDENR